MAENTNNNPTSTTPGSAAPAEQPAVAATPVSPVQASQQAMDQAQQAMVQAQQTANQVGQQAQQVATQAQQTATAVGQQAQQLAGTASQAGAQAQQFVKDYLMPKANQPKVRTDEKLWAMASYIPLVSLASLVLMSGSEYVKLHGRQGLLMSIILLFSIILAIFPFIGLSLYGLIVFVLFILSLFSAYQALIGNWWKIPVLGDIAEMIPVTLFAQITKEAITGQVSEQQPAAEGQQPVTEATQSGVEVQQPAPIAPAEAPQPTVTTAPADQQSQQPPAQETK
ncbi:hypothetical protein KBB06_03990 [Candidatus Gracilibacteria bacterium]|nr:hypothetical protein [Candidatus Gracilibacteria bacterium]